MVIDASGDLQASVAGYTGAGGIWTKDATTTLYARWITILPATLNKGNVNEVSEDMTYYNTNYLDFGPTDAINTGRWAEWDVYLTPCNYSLSITTTCSIGYGWRVSIKDTELTYDQPDLDGGTDVVWNSSSDWDLTSLSPGIYTIQVTNHREWSQPKLKSLTLGATVYTVTYDANGGTCGTASETVCGGSEVTLPSALGDGAFEGWYTSSDEEIGGTGDSYTPTADITLYAHWGASCSDPEEPTAFAATEVKMNRATFSITDDEDAASYDLYYASGTPSTPTSETTETENVTTKTPTITGLSSETTYKIWVRSVCDATHKSDWMALGAEGGAFTTPAPETYTITYNTDGAAEGQISDGEKTEGTSFTLSSTRYTKAGYWQVGWATSQGGSKVYNFGGTYIADADLTLYPAWVKIAVYNPDMSTETKLTTTIGAKFGEVDRWTLTTGSTLVSTPKAVSSTAENNLTGEKYGLAFTPNWSSNALYDLGAQTTLYQLTLDIVMGGNGSLTAELLNGSFGVVKTITDDIHIENFTAWEKKTFIYTYDAGLANVQYIRIYGNGSYVVGLTRIKAEYAPTKTKIVLDNQSATSAGTDTVTATYGASTNLTSSITAPSKTGYIFGGYYTEEDGEGTQLIDENGAWLASKTNYTDGDKKWQFANPDLTLYAKWDCTPISPTLTYSKNIIWLDDETLTATPTLDKKGSTGSVTYESSDATVVDVNESTGAITAKKRGSATITATIAEGGGKCEAEATCEIKVKSVGCIENVLASATRKSGSENTMENGTGSNYSASGIACENTGKLGTNDKHYMYITLTGTTLQDGDVVVINLNTVGDVGDGAIHLFAGTTSGSTEIGTKASPTTGDNEVILSGVPDDTYSVTMYRTSKNQNHRVDGIKVKRQICPDIKIFDAADNDSWSDNDNWVQAGEHGADLPTNEDRVYIKKSVTVDTDEAAAARVHITDGSTLTVKESVTMGDVEVQTGSTLNVSVDGEDNGVTFTVNSLSLKGGLNSSCTEYDMPRVYINSKSSLEKSESTVNFDISVDQRHYYPFAVPFKVEVKDVNYANSTLAKFAKYGATGQYVIKEYDGAGRAENGAVDANWKVVPNTAGTYLYPGKGYILTAVSLPAYGGGIIRFPLSFSDDWTTLGEQATVDETKNQVSVEAYEGTATEGGKNANKGWNMLGVPYMSCFASKGNYAHDAEGGFIKGKLNFITGEYTETSNVYVTVPTSDFSEYLQFNFDDADTKLLPGWCFFVQVDNDGTITFEDEGQTNSSSLPIYAPKREQEMPTVKTGIILSSETASDKTTILVSDKYSVTDYEINADLEKMFGNGYTLATYSLAGETRLAYNAMSRADATNVIPIGYRAPAEGEYTFAINPRYAENGDFERIDLIDYETGFVTNLLQSSYTFTSDRTQSDSRFALNVVPQKETPTDVEPVTGDGLPVTGARKVIIDNKLYIILNGKMYDATGRMVK